MTKGHPGSAPFPARWAGKCRTICSSRHRFLPPQLAEVHVVLVDFIDVLNSASKLRLLLLLLTFGVFSLLQVSGS